MPPMPLVALLLGALLSLSGARAALALPCDDFPLEIPGDAVLTALLPLGVGPGCTVVAAAPAAAPSPRGWRRAAAAAQVLSTLSRSQPLGLGLGLRILDSCRSDDIARKALLATLAQLDCLHLYSLGVLVGADESAPVSALSSGLGQALWELAESRGPEPQLSQALAALLAAGGWPAADVLTSSVHDDEGDDDPDGDSEHHLEAAEVLGDEAVEAARLLSVCARRGHAPDGFLWSGPPSRALVLSGVEAALRRTLRDHVVSQVDAEPRPQLVLVPPDGVWAGTPLPRGALLLLPELSDVRALLARLLVANMTLPLEEQDEEPLRAEDVAARVGLDDFLAVGRAVLQASDLLRAGVEAFCGEAEALEALEVADNATLGESSGSSGLCGRLPPPGQLREELQVRQVSEEELLALLELHPDPEELRPRAPRAPFTLLRSPGPGRALVPVAHYKDAQWTFLDDSLGQRGGEAVDCPSLLVDSQVEWVREAWVATVLTVAALGTLCATAVAFFIATRILAGDILEGSATLSLLLLVGVLVGYASALPYCVRGLGGSRGVAVCGLRLLAAPLAHALLLGVMLARALMLAACDHDGGLLSHVSGPLQAALCFFTVSVQVALSVQLGLVMSPSLCAALSASRFLLLVAYDGLLLVLLGFTAPFIFTSRRNYREGGLFAVTTGALLVVWACWLTLYLVGGHAWRDAAVGSGLTAASTAVLLGVFIPRTYLMAGAIVRDKLAAQLPALARDATITDLAFRDAGFGVAGRSVFYDGVVSVPAGSGAGSGAAQVPGGRVLAAPNLYDARPSTPLTPEDTYARYDVPSPLKVTRF